MSNIFRNFSTKNCGGSMSSFATLLIAVGLMSVPNIANANSVSVNCNLPSGNLQAAVSRAKSDDTITIRGLCIGNIVIKTDGITLRGDTVSDSVEGQVEIAGVQNVVIENMTVKDGSGHGIYARNGASIAVTNVTVQGHDGNGIFVTQNSDALLTGNTVNSNDRFEISVTDASSARLQNNTVEDDSPSTQTGAALGVYRSSFARLAGGNNLSQTNTSDIPFLRSVAVQVFHNSHLRQQNGADTITGVVRSVSVGNLSGVDFRTDFTLAGTGGPTSAVDVALTGSFRVRGTGSITGNISNGFGSFTQARSGSTVTLDGTCFGTCFGTFLTP